MSQNVAQLKEQLSAMTVTRHGWGAKRAGSKQENAAFASAIKADGDFTGTWKKVIDTDMDEWRDLMQTWHYVKYYWDGNTFPYVYEGVRLFYRDDRKKLVDELTRLNGVMKEKAGALDKKKDEIFEWGRAKFETTFDEKVYPKSWATEFSVSWQEHNIEPPKYLERDDAEEYKRELQRGLANIGNSMQMFEHQCYTRMAEVTYKLSQNLGKPTNGGISTNVKGMMELFDKIHQMRFEGTASFKKCMNEAKALIDGVEVDELKKPGGVREDVKERLDALIKKHKVLQEIIVAKTKEKV